MKGKLIIIEGTDCSGKETQCKRLVNRLADDGIRVFTMPFPRYDTPTGKIIGGPFLGKPSISESYFDDPTQVPGEVASLYYAADRLYNIEPIKEALNNGVNVILDRYIVSNMAFQGGKFMDKEKRHKMFKFIETLEYDLLGLPKEDATVFLYMPYEQACILKSKREEVPDKVEIDEDYLKNAENTYLELANMYDFIKIDCTNGNEIRSIEDINEELYKKVKEILNG